MKSAPSLNNKINNLNIGERIKILRTNQKRTLQEIAESSELSRSMISKIENNKTVPSVAALVKIARALGTTISDWQSNTRTSSARKNIICSIK